MIDLFQDDGLSIPKMTDPMSRHWTQPQGEILIDETHAMMRRIDFEALAEYSTTCPSGVYSGKMWKSKIRGHSTWYLRWYGRPSSENSVWTFTREIIVVD